MIVAVVGLDFARRRAGIEVPHNHAFSAGVCILAGAFAMMASAVGPIRTIYLLSMDLPKEEFVGTGIKLLF